MPRWLVSNPLRRKVEKSCSRNCSGISRRSASSLIGTGRSPARASSAKATTAYLDFEVIEITGSFYRTPRLGRIASRMSEPPHCLVIDGHPLVRLGIRDTLEGKFVVHEAHTREEGLELVRDIGNFDVAIVDMRWHSNGDGS